MGLKVNVTPVIVTLELLFTLIEVLLDVFWNETQRLS